jgi:ABC-2 type transport system permease protein
MAGLSIPSLSGAQLRAIVEVRWHLFIHSLRTKKGALELFSRIIVSLVITSGGLGGAILLGVGAWYFVSQGKTEGLTLLLWPVFVFWQMFPLMATALTETIDSSHLLRFPLNYRAYAMVRLIYGALDPATVLGGLWLVGITLGVGWARPSMLLWAALVLGVFGLANLLLTQMIFAWVERWLAQRRTREVFAVLFFVALLGLQLIGPMINRYGDRSNAAFQQAGRVAGPLQALLPPGIAAKALADWAQGNSGVSVVWLVLLLAYAAAILRVLNLRLRAQYLGENLSEVSGGARNRVQPSSVVMGWQVPGLPGDLVAVLEKEFRYLARSGPVLLTFITPIVMLFVFGLGGRSGSAGFLQHWPQLALPVGASYALLLLTNLIYNNFGPDGGGIQFFLVSPVSFRHVMMGKNLAHMGVLALEVIVLTIGVSLMYRPPTPAMVLVTVAALLFAAPINLAAGNLFSLYSPKKTEFGTFGRQRASQTTVLASFAIQAAVFGIAGIAMFAVLDSPRQGLALLMFLGLDVMAILFYSLVLARVDSLAMRRSEVLAAELCK